jgi:hypothetical protein
MEGNGQFTLVPLYFQGKNSWYGLRARRVSPRTSNYMVKKRKIPAFAGNETVDPDQSQPPYWLSYYD